MMNRRDGPARAVDRGPSRVESTTADEALQQELWLRVDHVGAQPGRRLVPCARRLPQGSIAAVFPAQDPPATSATSRSDRDETAAGSSRE